MRDGMSDLVTQLRTMTNAGSADYTTVGAVSWWTDDQVQQVLDLHRNDVYREFLEMVINYQLGGTARYFDYYWTQPNVEQRESGTAAWMLTTTSGSAIGTELYSVEYGAQHIRFVDNQKGTVYLLNYRSYDLDRAAADMWREKAGHVADRFDVQTDNHTLTRSQLVKQYLQMADLYRKRGKPKMIRLDRSDVW